LPARDTHRLGLEVLHAAASRGARIANHLEVDAYRLESGRVAGVEVTDRRSGEHFPIAARTVVNAAGPWAGDLSRAAGLSTAFMPPAWTGAMNVVLRRSLGNTAAVALSSPRHNREFFFVPWRGVTLIGTDYFPVDAAGGAAGTAPAQAVEQFVNEAAALAPAAGITPQDVALVHWGLLPLAARGDRLPARHPVLASGQAETGASGLVVLVAEKLTSAPMLSLQVMDRVRHELGGAGTSGGRQSVPSAPADPGMSPDGLDPVVTARLAARYGARWPAVASLAQADDSLLEPLVAASPVLKVELSHAIRGEMALTIPDLVRRLALGDAGEPDATVLGACEHFAATQWR
jgi:glycerol-3-phosphate dehydrogenase